MASFIISLIAIGVAVLSWAEAHRANRRADRAVVNLDFGEPESIRSVYEEKDGQKPTRRVWVTVLVVGTGLATSVRVVRKFPKTDEASEVIAEFPSLAGGASRRLEVYLYPRPRNVVEVFAEWHDADGPHTTSVEQLSVGRPPGIHHLDPQPPP